MSLFSSHLDRLLRDAGTRSAVIAQASERVRADADRHDEFIAEALKDIKGDPGTVRAIKNTAASIVETRANLLRHLAAALAEAEMINARTHRIWDLILSDWKPIPWNPFVRNE